MRYWRGAAVLVAVGVLAAVGAGVASPALPRVAVCATIPSNDADVVSKLTATGLFDTVDYINCRSTTPTVAELQAYAAVLVYPDAEVAAPGTLSNNLADYVGGGGRLVLAVFTFADDPSYWSGGRLITGGYLPVALGSTQAGIRRTLVADLPGHPLLAGVTSFDGGSSSWQNTVALAAGATLVAHWSGNDVPLVAFKGNVVALNFYPPSNDVNSGFWDKTTGGVRLLTNALTAVLPSASAEPARAGYCAVSGNTNPNTGKAITPGTFLDLSIGQPATDSNYKGALPANSLQGAGISCHVPAGYVKTGEKVGYAGSGDPGIYDYHKKG